MANGNRVLICVPCLLVGGTEIHTLLLAKALISGGYQVTVCAYFEHDPITLEEFRQQGVEVVLLSLDRLANGKNIGKMPELLFALMKVMRDVRPRAVHVQYMAPGLTPLLAAKLCEVSAVVATVHVTANHYGKRRWMPRNVAASLCDVFLCVSQTAEASFFGEAPRQFSRRAFERGRRHFTIHNCVDLDRIDAVILEGSQDALRKSLNLSGKTVVGIVGRLDPYKGHELLLRAMACIVREYPDAVLLCVGGGTVGATLEAEAMRLGISDKVIFTGRMSQTDVFRHLRLMDIVAMPSRVGLEGFGLAAAEAMAMGRPIVASNADALAEVIGDNGDAGLLIAPGDVSALTAQICRLMVNPRERTRLGSAARARVEEKFSMKLFTERHLSLYEALCNPGSQSAAGSQSPIGALA
jgi:glycosyltransferase involved in cell wall biosynthesis